MRIESEGNCESVSERERDEGGGRKDGREIHREIESGRNAEVWELVSK